MALRQCGLSLKLVVVAALRYGVVILLFVLSGRAKPIFFSVVALNASGFFSCLLLPCFVLTLQDKPFVVWLMLVRVGLFLMGSENRIRALISF